VQVIRFVVILLCGCATARAAPFVVATYNVENYTAADRMTAEGFRHAYPKPEPEKKALRTVIRALHADVLVLEEMGPQPYLDELRRDLAREGAGYPFAFLLEGPDPDRHVAVLSRRPWTAVTPHADLEFSYFGRPEKVKRGLLEADFAGEGGGLTIFMLHLKSRITDQADDPLSAARRAGEAKAVRDLILEKFPDPSSSRFLVIGDFNDDLAGRALRLLMHRGKMEIATALPAADSRGEMWTEFYRKEQTYSAIDHVLVSPGLLAAVRSGRAHVFDGPGVALASDHRPVVVMLDFAPAEREKK
jgi:endonuclease/exonuclease/phosphatase family metal-dependent hydrolase